MASEFLRPAPETTQSKDSRLLLVQYLDLASKRPELGLEYSLLEEVGLYNPKRPERSKLLQMTEQPLLAQRTLSQLNSTGDYPESAVLGMRNQVVESLERKYKQQVLFTAGWRLFRIGTIVAPGVKGCREVLEFGTTDPGSIAIAMTPALIALGFWAVVDRATAYPQREYRIDAMIGIDERIFKDPELSERSEFGKRDTAMGVKVKQYLEDKERFQRQEKVSEWLDSGRSPKDIIEILSSRKLHSPLRSSQDILESKFNKIDYLDPDNKGPRWDSKEAFYTRRKVRREVMRKVLRSAYITF